MTKQDNKISYAIIIICGLFYSLMSWLTPYHVEDLHYYVRPFIDYFLGHDNSTLSLHEYSKFLVIHYTDVNGRIANLVAPIFIVLCPKWIFALLTGMAMAWTTWLMVKISSSFRNYNSLTISIIVLLSIILLPWYTGTLFSFAYTLNYIWPTTLSVWVAYLFLKPTSPNKKWHWWISTGILAILAGGFHEGFSAPLLCAMGLDILLNIKGKQDLRKWWLLIMCAIGSLSPILSPAMWSRADTSSDGSGVSMAYLILFMSPLILMCILALTAICKKSWRNGLLQDKELLIFCATTGIISGIIFFRFFSGARAFWVGAIFCIIACATICRHITIKIPPKYISIGIWILILPHMITTIIWQYKISVQYESVLERFICSEDGVVYEDVIRLPEIPKLCNRKVSYLIMSTKWQQECISRVYGRWKKVLSILPTSFRNFDANKAKNIGNNFYLYEGYLLSDNPTFEDNLIIKDEYYIFLTNSNEETHGIATIPYPFKDTTGKKWHLLYPTYCYQNAGNDVIKAKIRKPELRPSYSDTTTLSFRYFVKEDNICNTKDSHSRFH